MMAAGNSTTIKATVVVSGTLSWGPRSLIPRAMTPDKSITFKISPPSEIQMGMGWGCMAKTGKENGLTNLGLVLNPNGF
jgi:hypothetical protein